MESKILTIMLTDMKGFTESSSQRSREELADLVRKHDQLLRPVVEHFGGRVIKTMGDAFLVVFESPTNAVLAGMVMQHKLGEYNESVEEALCYGWVDSQIKKIDEQKFARRFTPRNARSRWSGSNRKRVAELLEKGLMTEHGMVCVEAAKVSGLWNPED